MNRHNYFIRKAHYVTRVRYGDKVTSSQKIFVTLQTIYLHASKIMICIVSQSPPRNPADKSLNR
jgi:hypothetical protein